MLRPIRFITCLMAASTVSIPAIITPQIYRNAEFGIELPVPQGSVLCPALPGEHDHGPLFLLRTDSAKGCNDPEGNRTFGVFASFNAASATSTVSKYVSVACKETYQGKCRSAPRNLGFEGHPSMAVMADLAGGWIDISVVCQAGKPDQEYHPSQKVNYEAILHTRAQYLEGDLRIFRTFLKTIRLSPAP